MGLRRWRALFVYGVSTQQLGFTLDGAPLGDVTNLNGEPGVSTAVVTGVSGGYQAFPIAPRMALVTLQADF